MEASEEQAHGDGAEENFVEVGSCEKRYDTDSQDSELEEGELPKRSYFTCSETSLGVKVDYSN